jgi:hypothetical protein
MAKEKTYDLVRRLAAEGKPAGAIAAELGISRQYVYQMASVHGISVPRAGWRHVQRSGPVQPVARVMTGGVSVPVNATVAGSIGELLVTADLLARGWFVYAPVIRQRHHDLIASKGNRLVTIEVRSAVRSGPDGCVRFNRTSVNKSDAYALVVTGEPVIYRPDDWLTDEADAKGPAVLSNHPNMKD